MIDVHKVNSPCFLLDEVLLRENLEKIRYVAQTADVEIIMALKGFAMWRVFDIIREYLPTCTASSLNEALLCYNHFKAKAHVYAAAYMPSEFDEIMDCASHLTFNSVSQYERFRPRVEARGGLTCGIRVNPEYSEVTTELYNPCAPGSRLGATRESIGERLPDGVEGLHFHALCENNSYTFEKVLLSFENLFGDLFPRIKWVNFGGGHLITHADYDIEHLITTLKAFKARHPHLHVIMEPGAAIAWRTGYLITEVLDIVDSKGIKTLMLDTSFTAHMPDVLEMPYRPGILDAHVVPIEWKPTYRLGGMSCLSGDYINEYSFDKALEVGDRLVFEDMMHYTMVKTTMFNGVKHPDIAIKRANGEYETLRRFTYQDFEQRL